MTSHQRPVNSGGLHVAIIMDGNGRWAGSRGLPRIAGHHEGAGTVRRVVEAAPRIGIRTLSLYAFSSDNWHRPAREVSTLMELLRAYLLTETVPCVRHGIRVNVIGRRDRLPPALCSAIQSAESSTKEGSALHLRIAVDYSSRESIWRAACRLKDLPNTSLEIFPRLLAEANHEHTRVPDVDLLIRTGGEQRLSDFLLWECAYAEFFFSRQMWPEFTADDLAFAVREFHTRERRFGRIPQAATA